jgi:hypothetical protein
MEASMKNRFRTQKKAVAFFITVPLLLLTSVFQVHCPVCNGTGEITNMPGSENLEITGSKFEETYVSRQICEMYIIYQYKVDLSIKNTGKEDSAGWVKLVLREFGKGRVMDVKYVQVAVPAETSVETQYSIWFQSGLDAPDQTEVYAELVKDGITCAVCNGSGKVALNFWLLAHQMRTTLRETARTITPYVPPIYRPPDSIGSDTEGAAAAIDYNDVPATSSTTTPGDTTAPVPVPGSGE